MSHDNDHTAKPGYQAAGISESREIRDRAVHFALTAGYTGAESVVIAADVIAKFIVDGTVPEVKA